MTPAPASPLAPQLLVNNAGVYGRRLGLLELEAADFLEAFSTNTVGPFLVVQQLVKHRLLGGPPGSTVVNVSSIMASHGDQTVSSAAGGGYAYRWAAGTVARLPTSLRAFRRDRSALARLPACRASKAGLNIINKALAMDLAEQQVQCVLLHPGYVKTDLTGAPGAPAGRRPGCWLRAGRPRSCPEAAIAGVCQRKLNYWPAAGCRRSAALHSVCPWAAGVNRRCTFLAGPCAGGQGWITVDESADGMMAVLESGRELNGRFFGFNGEQIPW
jgi:NAD(P)-dependent dehydrogenase (short-subunit alcohol dehydrogenase family)